MSENKSPGKPPISFAEAEAFAEKYLDAPPEVCAAQFDFLCGFVLTDTWEDMNAKQESKNPIIAAMCRLAGEPIPPKPNYTEEEKTCMIEKELKRLERKAS